MVDPSASLPSIERFDKSRISGQAPFDSTQDRQHRHAHHEGPDCCVHLLRLTLRTKIGPPAPDLDPLDPVAALGTRGPALTGHHGNLHPQLLGGRRIDRKAGHKRLDSPGQDTLDSGVYRLHLRAGDLLPRLQWMDRRVEQDFVGVYVPDAGDQLLLQEQCLHRRSPLRQNAGQRQRHRV